MEKMKKLFRAIALETKIKEVHLLVEIIADMEPNRKTVCEIVGIPYDSETMKGCSRAIFAKRAGKVLQSRILSNITGFVK